jgi:hypothetical protein
MRRGVRAHPQAFGCLPVLSHQCRREGALLLPVRQNLPSLSQSEQNRPGCRIDLPHDAGGMVL